MTLVLKLANVEKFVFAKFQDNSTSTKAAALDTH